MRCMPISGVIHLNSDLADLTMGSHALLIGMRADHLVMKGGH